jgi:hypothetical protein
MSCVLGKTAGDFDGDGTRDRATLVDVAPAGRTCKHALALSRPRLHVHVVFGSGGETDGKLTHCTYGPCSPPIGRPFTATDLDGDGRSELAIEVGPGSAIDYVEFFQVTRHAVHPLRIAPDPAFQGDHRALFELKPGPAALGGGFDSGLQSPVACQVRPDGTRVLVFVQAENLGGGTWRVIRVDLQLRDDILHVVQISKTAPRGLGIGPRRFQVACS